VLIVGAGPTGLTLAAQLAQFGTRFRIIDRLQDRAQESRALGVQARSLEILQHLGLGDDLAARGNRSATVTMHVEGRVAPRVSLSDFAAPDTRYPYILFVSQAETEGVLAQHLAERGVVIERGTELTQFTEGASGVSCELRNTDGQIEHVDAQYLVGCDGAHSAVRKGAHIPFEGEAYLQDFMLGDIEVDASPDVELTKDSIHPFVGGQGIAMFFPLGHPASWRVIAMSARNAAQSRLAPAGDDKPQSDKLSLEELQQAIDGATGGGVRAHSAVWLTHFRLHHRQATHYRRGRVFIAGDAAHIHSPVGAQGMNTGIQDAWNLGWKLALVIRGAADERLLDTYEAERWPVGRALLRYTDRAFGMVVRSLTPSPLASWLRRTVPGRVIPLVLSSQRLRTYAFRFVSELNIRYRRSPAVLEGTPRIQRGPRAGDRLPDQPVVAKGQATWLQEATVGPRFCLLLCGSEDGWDFTPLRERALPGDLLTVRYMSSDGHASDIVDTDGKALAMLGVTSAAQYLIRPDGYIAFRCAGRDLSAVAAYLASWFKETAALDDVALER
jgi:2-polyprenyl-6-methoxyphenol hydroxylase-like FAD-dependent oxidoreductase